MKHLKIVALAVVAIMVGSVILFSTESNNKSVEMPSSSSGATYTIGDYQLTVLSNTSMWILSKNVSLVVDATLYTYSEGKFIMQKNLHGSVNRISNNFQNSVALIDQFSDASVTFIFTQSAGGLYSVASSGISVPFVVSSSTADSYIDFNISLGFPTNIYSGGFSYDNPAYSLDSHYGSYVIGSGSGLTGVNVGYLNGQAGAGWQQMYSLNHIDYGVVTVGVSGDYYNLMTGPFYSGARTETTFAGINFSII